MEEKTKKAQEKLSVDQLKELVQNLSQENQMLVRRIQQTDYASMLLSMLFRVVENSDKFDQKFVSWCTEGIQSSIESFMDATSPVKENDEDK